MCQPLPGPRCSNHARRRLDEARRVKEAAEQAHSACEARRPTPGQVPPAEYAAWREETLAARIAESRARQDYQQALRDFEATPAGMRTLQAALDRVGQDTSEGRAIAESLTVARETRARQVADLRASRAMAARLAALTPNEQAALDQHDAAVGAAERAHAQASADLAAATERMREFTAATRTLLDAAQQAEQTRSQALEAARAARETVRAEATRLYRTAGVSPKFADFYADDTLVTAAPDEAAEEPGKAGVVPTRTPALKVKAAGPDMPKTRAARAAAQSDEAFTAAVARWEETGRRATAAHLAAMEAHRRAGDPWTPERHEARRAEQHATYAHEETGQSLAKATTARTEFLARVGSGAGTQPLTAVTLASARDEFARNPDGTTNAWVYAAPSEGFPHGRYLRAVGVTTVSGMGPVNALVLENGETAVLRGHYARTTRGAGETRSGQTVAYITPAQDGATPLRAEGVADSGFYAFVDTSD